VDMVERHYTKQDSRNKIGISADKTTIALLPGSRLSEVTKLLPEMLLAAEIISQKIPAVQFVLPLAETLKERIIFDITQHSPVKIKVISGKTYDVIASADLAIVASGTATLETGLLGVPMIIIYKVSFFFGIDRQNDYQAAEHRSGQHHRRENHCPGIDSIGRKRSADRI